MSNRNILQALQSAGGAGGATLDVDDVFSTFLYEGTGSVQGVLNNIDLDGEGGLVWGKCRNNTNYPYLFDTERGVGKVLYSNVTWAEGDTGSNYVYMFKNNGFNIGTGLSVSGQEHVTWTFRKAPKFFDIVTYTGNGAAGRTVSHNLGSVPGMIIVKTTAPGSNPWAVYHRGYNGGSSPQNYYALLNDTASAASNSGYWNNTAPTDTVFTVGSNNRVNGNGDSYVAYIFAHNNSDGEFGTGSDQDIIKCGFYTGNGSSQEINLGFEPQWILHRRVNNTAPWRIYDSMRGINEGSADAYLSVDTNAAELTYNEAFRLTPTGFKVPYSAPYYNGSGDTYIYVAIRRGPIAVPKDATKVFSVNLNTGGGNVFTTGFAGDMNLATQTTAQSRLITQRLTDRKYLLIDHQGAENTLSSSRHWDKSNTTIDLATGYVGSGANYVSYTWRKAPGYFDVRAYDGGTTSISHGLGVVPEMIWVKRRDGTSPWAIYHKDTGLTKTLQFDTYAPFTNTTFTGVFDETFRGQTTYTNINYNNMKYVAYLFATAPGVSKVGSYTGNGVSGRVIDCGFSNGARFVLIKGITSNGYNWCVWDSARGIVSGNDPKIELETVSAQQTGYDFIDPSSSGFSVTAQADVNGNNVEYIFYAIA